MLATSAQLRGLGRLLYSPCVLDTLHHMIMSCFRFRSVRNSPPQFRTKSYHIVTTLLDAKVYPAAELAEVYFRRWDVGDGAQGDYDAPDRL